MVRTRNFVIFIELEFEFALHAGMEFDVAFSKTIHTLLLLLAGWSV